MKETHRRNGDKQTRQPKRKDNRKEKKRVSSKKKRKGVIERDERRLRAAKFWPLSLLRPPHVLACHCHEAAAAASSERGIAHHLVALFCSCLKSGENQPIISRHDPPWTHSPSCIRMQRPPPCGGRTRTHLIQCFYCGGLGGREKEKSSPNENLWADGITV